MPFAVLPVAGRDAATCPSGLAYLGQQQRPDGSWLPLWFGNQHAPDDENPTYGTARVLAAYRDLSLMDSGTGPPRQSPGCFSPERRRRLGRRAAWPSSIEETALAVEVLLDAGPDAAAAVKRGLAWLVEQVEAGDVDKSDADRILFC